jgi:hypothetical protein
MVQNKPRIGSCTKPYVRSIPSTMGVDQKLKRWIMRKRGFAIGRMYYAHPTSSERYYL